MSNEQPDPQILAIEKIFFVLGYPELFWPTLAKLKKAEKKP